MPKPFDRNQSTKTKTVVTAFTVFCVEQMTVETSESSDDRPTPAATSNQTSGTERERLRPSRPVGPGLVSVREAGNVFSIHSRRKAG
jgi:hypothetical protein